MEPFEVIESALCSKAGTFDNVDPLSLGLDIAAKGWHSAASSDDRVCLRLEVGSR